MYRRTGIIVAAAAMGMLVAGTPALAANPNAAVLAWSPTNPSGGTGYDFGTVDGVGGQHPTQTFTLTNSGGRSTGTLAPVALTNTSGTAFSIASDSCSGLSLGPNNSCQVAVKCAPATSGESDSATLTATGEHANASIMLTGQTGTPDLTLSPGTLGTGPQGAGTGTLACPTAGECGDPNGTKSYNYDMGSGSSATQTFTVHNNGTGTSNALQLACCNAGFTVSNDQTSGVMLPPGGTSTFQLTFTAPAGCSRQLFATPLLVTSATASPDIRVTYSASCGPAITSVTATLKFVAIGSGPYSPIGVGGTLKNLSFRGNPPPLRGGGLHGFTIQIPFSMSQGSLNCDASRSYAVQLGGSGTCSVNNNVLTVTQNFPPSWYWYWAPGRSDGVTYASVGSSLPTGVDCCAYVTWGKPTVTAAS